MTKGQTIQAATVLELKNVPTGLILYAVSQWTMCRKYTTKRTVGNNTNNFLKGISIWIILKNETSSGRLHMYRQQLSYLAERCKVSERTLDKYITWLRKEKLVRLEGGVAAGKKRIDQSLVMCDYKVLRKYGIDINQREQTIYYDTTDNTKLSEIIVSIALGNMKHRWRQMYWKKVSKNLDALAEVRNHLIAFGADQNRLDDLEYFRECHLDLLVKTYKEEKPGLSSFYLLHEFIDANPDLNCRQDTYAFSLGLATAMSFCHIKFKLINSKLITVRKDHIRSEYRARKNEKMFHHRWLDKAKQTIWFRVDQVTVNYNEIFAPKCAI